MTIWKLLATLLVTSAVALPTAAGAAILLDNRIYPEHRRAELIASCQGLQGQANESLTAEEPFFEETGDPASDYRLKGLSFTLRDCKEAGLIR